MKKLIKPLSLVLTAVLLVGLMAGCGGEKTKAEPETPEFVYTASYKDIGVDLEYINGACLSGGRIIMAGQVAIPGEAGSVTPKDAAVAEAVTADAVAMPVPEDEYVPTTYVTKLYSMALDGSDIKELTAYKPTEIPEGTEGSVNLNRMIAGANGSVWALEEIYNSWYDESMPAGTDPNSEEGWQYYRSSQDYRLINLSGETGEEITTVPLDFLKPSDDSMGEKYFYINAFVVDAAGNVYATGDSNNVSVADSTGALLFTLAPVDGWVSGLISLKDGTVGALAYDNEGKSSIMKIDAAKKSWSDTGVVPPANAWNFYPGTGEYDFYYGTDTSFFGFDMTAGASENLVTWINADVDFNTIGAVMPGEDGTIYCISSDYSNYGAEKELVTMAKTPYEESEKTTLTYACMWLDYNIRAKIIEFNKKSDKYRIEVRDYSEYNTGEDYNAGMTKLNTEIIAGQVPDILGVSSLPIRQYAAKGLLEDLWPFVEADAELGGRSGLVEPVMNALAQDGKLYQIASSFYVSTTYALTSVVGEEPGWTLEEMKAALDKLNPGASILDTTMVKSDWVNYICGMYMDTLVDWESGKCTFSDPLFVELLKMSERLPATFDYNNFDWEHDYVDPTISMPAGDQLMNYYYFSSFNDALWNGSLKDYTFVGFPTADGTSGSSFQVDGAIAMSSRCKDKEGAWEFIRSFLTEDYQKENVWSLPTNKAAYDAQIKDAMTPETYVDENGETQQVPKGSYTDAAGNQIDIYALDQQTADKLMALVNATTRLASYDESISSIIVDECAAYFAGAKTAEDTAAAIQSKVSLYISEQK